MRAVGILYRGVELCVSNCVNKYTLHLSLLTITGRFCVNFVPSYRDVADKLGEAKIGLQNGAGDEEHAGGVLGEPEKGMM